MLPIISLLIVISLSILLTRIATVALTLTGLSREAARFQARSALTGTGFTTAEAEKAVGHPVRRRIILFLMLLGNAGIVVLGIERPGGMYLGAPQPDGLIRVGDVLLLYGRAAALEQLDSRENNFTGAVQHEHAVARQDRVAAGQDQIPANS